MKYKFAHIIS